MGQVDDRTVERLLRGALTPEDASHGYGGVATLLHEARTEARAATSVRAEDTIAAMVAAVARNQPKVPASRRPARRVRSRVAAGAAAGFVAVFGSLTAAGALPSPAQNGVSTVLAKVGIDVPRDGGDDKPSNSKNQGNQGNPANSSEDPATTNHGQCVSEVAGRGGQVVSEVAQSDCGKDPKEPGGNGNGPPGGEPPGQTKDKTPPTHPPQSNSGGSGGSGNSGGNGNGNGPGSNKPDK
jgi:hypothetical protein